MREIKFRVWDSTRKIMHRVRDIRDMHLREFNNWSLRLEDEKNNDVLTSGTFLKLMQFTGLKDKNGKEIFEGDIVFAKPDFKGEVIFETIEINHTCSTAFLIKYKDGTIGGIGKDVEIIGNIYENPKLLNDALHASSGGDEK